MLKKSMYVIALVFIILFVFNSCITIVFPEDGSQYKTGSFRVNADKLKDRFTLTDNKNITYKLVGLSRLQKEQLKDRDGRWIRARIKILSGSSSLSRNAQLIRIYR